MRDALLQYAASLEPIWAALSEAAAATEPVVAAARLERGAASAWRR